MGALLSGSPVPSRPQRHFSSLADIVAPLAKAERDSSLRERIRYYRRHFTLRPLRSDC